MKKNATNLIKDQYRELSAKIDTLKTDDPQRNALDAERQALLNRYNFPDEIFTENGLKGIRAFTGEVLVPARYLDFAITDVDLKRHHSPVIAILKDKSYRLVKTDGVGTELGTKSYGLITWNPFLPYYLYSENKKTFGFMNIHGEPICPDILEKWCEPSNGIIPLKAGDKWGVLTNWGLYITPIYDDLTEDSDLVYVRFGDKWGYLTDEGKFVDEDDKETLDSVNLLDYLPKLPDE